MFGAKTLLISALAAFAAAQSTVLSFTHVPNPITDGKAQTITFSTNDTSSPATILLRKGPSNNLKTIDTLTTDAHGGIFTWTPATSLANGDNYALEIKQGTQVNYFGPFTIQGGSGSGSGSASASMSMSASASVSKNATMTTSASSSMITSARNATMSSSSMITSTRNSTMNGTIPATLTTPKKTSTVAPITSSGSPSSASSAPSSAAVSASSVPTANAAANLYYSSGVLGLGAMAVFAGLL